MTSEQATQMIALLSDLLVWAEKGAFYLNCLGAIAWGCIGYKLLTDWGVGSPTDGGVN